MIRNLEKGTDRQLTFDKKFADDQIWSATGHIIYSSNTGGNVNLWMIPSSGGEPTQLTRGSGPDSPDGITDDGKRLMYSELQDIGQVKIAGIDDGTVHQLTVDDRIRGVPAISASGKYIVFPAQEIDAVSQTMNIYVMDRDGGNTRKLTDDLSYKEWPSFSPDEKWITYAARAGTEPPDSSRVYLIQVDKPGHPKLLGYGNNAYWYSEKEFVVWSSMAMYKGSLDRPGLERFSEDSILAVPPLGEKYVAMFDWHQGHEGWSITTASLYKSSGIQKAKQICRGFYYGTFAQGGKEFFYWNNVARELHRVSLPDGKDERIKGTFPGLSIYFSVSDDGKQIVYTENYRKTRFLIIDNVFK
jgi:Tol biopolymer transport system component